MTKLSNYYSPTAGNRPAAENVEVGELWINLADSVVGTKNTDGNLLEFAQFTADEKAKALAGGDGIPKTGVVAGITMSSAADNKTGNIVIDDDSNDVIACTLTGDMTVTVNKTTGHKSTKLVVSKAANATGTITWEGVDEWLSTAAEPTFGASADAQELCVAIFSSPTINAVNTVYNTENPTEVSSDVTWGSIGGTLSAQTDLTAEFAKYLTTADADKTYAKQADLSSYVKQDNTKDIYISSEVADKYTSTLSVNGDSGSVRMYSSGAVGTAQVWVSGAITDETPRVAFSVWNASDDTTYSSLAANPDEAELRYYKSGNVTAWVSANKNGVSFQDEDNGYVSLSDLRSVFTAAGADKNGEKGLVPAPLAGDTGDAFLRSDGAWASVPFTQINADWDATEGEAQILNKPDLTVYQKTADAFTQTNADGLYLGKTANAATATKLATPRTITLTGGATSVATAFDGSSDITLSVTAVDGTKVSAMTAATATTAGKAGAVPAPAAGKQTAYLRGDGTWAVPTNTTYSTFTAATATTAGAVGLVPAPAAGDQTKFLKADGTWGIPTDTNSAVSQAQLTGNNEYPVIFKNTTATTAITTGVGFGAGITANPATSAITATTFIGALSGKATSAATADTATTATTATSATTAETANKVGTASVGSATLPVYINAGVPTATGTSLAVSITGNAATATKATTAGSATTATTATTANKTAAALSLQLNGGTAVTFDGSSAKSVNVTPSAISAIPLSGSRGTLAGYETVGSDTTISQTSADSVETSSAVTVNNGTAGTSWTKIVHLTSSSPSVTLGSNWKWQGGSQGTMNSGCFLILGWCGSAGIAVVQNIS